MERIWEVRLLFLWPEGLITLDMRRNSLLLQELSLVKVYTKKRGAHPDLDDPICLRKGSTIEVRRVTQKQFSFNRVYG